MTQPKNILPLTLTLLFSEVDQSGLNGDSSAKEKGPGISEGNPLEAANLAFYHSRAISGWCVGLVYCTGEEKEKYIFKP